jgi:hypothetical protein
LDRPDKTLRSASPRLRNRMPVRRSVLASDVALRSEVRRIHAPVSPKAVSGQCALIAGAMSYALYRECAGQVAL